MSAAKNAVAAGAVGLVAVGASEVIVGSKMYEDIPANVAKAMSGKPPEDVAKAVKARQRMYRLAAGFLGGVAGVIVVAMFTGESVKSPTK